MNRFRIMNASLAFVGRVWPSSIDDRKLIIVAGMPKSGTTAIARLLGAAIQQRVCSDPFYQLDVLNIPFREQLFSGALDIGSLWRRYPAVFDGPVIKDPNFPLFLPQLKRSFRKARFVFIVRDPRDNLRSILNRVQLPGDPTLVPAELPGVAGAWRNVLMGRFPEVPGTDYLEHMAWRWRKSVEGYRERAAEIVLIRYEDFRADKYRAIEALSAQLGHAVKADISPLLDVQFQPRGKTDTDPLAFFGRDGLQRIETIVGPFLEEFGYERLIGAEDTHNQHCDAQSG